MQDIASYIYRKEVYFRPDKGAWEQYLEQWMYMYNVADRAGNLPTHSQLPHYTTQSCIVTRFNFELYSVGIESVLVNSLLCRATLYMYIHCSYDQILFSCTFVRSHGSGQQTQEVKTSFGISCGGLGSLSHQYKSQVWMFYWFRVWLL